MLKINVILIKIVLDMILKSYKILLNSLLQLDQKLPATGTPFRKKSTKRTLHGIEGIINTNKPN